MERMKTDKMIIRDATGTDYEQWLKLWEGYNAFYNTSIEPDTTEHTFTRIITHNLPVIGRVAECDGKLVGMTVSVIHEGTWTRLPILYLEDLFVDPEIRGAGIGRALMTDIIEQARIRGCSRIYWHTRSDNLAARKLYDQFVPADDFVRYRIVLDDGNLT